MAVGVKRNADVGMPEHLRDSLEVDAFSEQERGARVPEVVESHVGQPSSPQKRLPAPVVGIFGVNGSPERLGTGGRTPSRSCSSPPATRLAPGGADGMG